MYAPVFRKNRDETDKRRWVVTVLGYSATGKTKREAHQTLMGWVRGKNINDFNNVRWIKADSAFFKR